MGEQPDSRQPCGEDVAGSDVRNPAPPPFTPLTADVLARYRESHTLSATLPICRELLGEAAHDSASVYAVSDAAGLLLWVEGDPATRSLAARMNFVEGALWAKAKADSHELRTEAAGTPVRIVTEAHIDEAGRSWSCVAVPIRHPRSGNTLGVVHLTGGDSVASPHAIALVRATASAIEAELDCRLAPADLLA